MCSKSPGGGGLQAPTGAALNLKYPPGWYVKITRAGSCKQMRAAGVSKLATSFLLWEKGGEVVSVCKNYLGWAVLNASAGAACKKRPGGGFKCPPGWYFKIPIQIRPAPGSQNQHRRTGRLLAPPLPHPCLSRPCTGAKSTAPPEAQKSCKPIILPF